uniref:NADH-ubiquinone oxidoreductase chain 1 n=1 Tax=Phakopsora pachyrhizi TaxID=170000 RepID=D8V112_PHAPC|nr:NAD1 [Phakopsora pachyrhizi]ACT15480.1 NAD1 [Phakopsora pachyrhizi]
MVSVIYSLVEVIVVVVPIILSVAFITIIERKVIASMQRRVGPNVVGVYGVLQPFSDALKLIVKEIIVPHQSNKVLLFIAPIVTLTFSLLGWGVVPIGQGLAISDISLGVLYTIALSSVSLYGILFAGWASNSKYAFLGGLRSTAQILSYELIISSVILAIILITSSFNYTTIIIHQQSTWFVVPIIPLFVVWLISILAETNRTPFDLAEAESELVSGFNTDYSGIIFVMYFLAEYSNIILISTLTAIFFFGGFIMPEVIYNDTFFSSQSIILALKTSVFCFAFVWFRASLPRLRYDQLMITCWLILLPIVIGIVVFMPCVLVAFDITPSVLL